MRTMRLPVAGAVIVILLAALAVATVAENVSIKTGGADHVTAAFIEPVHVSGPEPAPGTSGVTRNQWKYEIDWDSSTPLPTNARLVLDEDQFFLGGDRGTVVICWGNLGVEDSDGWLTGPIHGYLDEEGQGQMQAVLRGGGIYEDLGMILTGPFGGEHGGFAEGLVFEGTMPNR